MNNSVIPLLVVFSFFFSISILSQDETDKGIFVQEKDGYYQNEILKSVEDFAEPKEKKKKLFKLDFYGMDLPKSKDEFTSYWFNEPVSQGRTGTCWCFSTTSFFESEVYRLHGKKVKLSEMYTAYWEYVEKAKRFIKERGSSAFAEGSEANAVPRIWKLYGIVPIEAYTGLQPGQKFHDHKAMFKEMKKYLKSIQSTNAWNEEEAITVIKSILNHYIGEPPSEFYFESKKYSPNEFLNEYIQLNLDDYVDILSYMQQPYYQQVEYEVPDNWWHSDIYYNVPLNAFMDALKNAIRNGYTMTIGGDVSEAGYDSWNKVGVIPTFDIPSEYIDESARQFRFSNKTTTDDHGIHLVGYIEKDGVDWYLIKDSGSGSRNIGDKGFYFYHEDYIKLKIMDFMVHKDAVENILKKFKEQIK
ncbi:MAG: peptidase C1 [Ignavibacteria bacterium]|nr:peptidase C1 [Ignavibacteria bacterium]MBT8382981.1 peptidase C1 [Ignavibacteria bacterium]MBT8391430.1 peptidase C1 [Ignavibacteria bacterium]NNJ54290.1 peptidase C1 [Ignavibacteriaceae bacterium]NNL21995.1 peptidase C1 [Ignavibacteriaceae bacterium]